MAVTKGHVILDPSSGSGDTQLTLKAESANVGNREIVSTVFTIKAAGVTPDKTITANLAAAPEFITLDQASTGVTVPATAGRVTITGVSNSPKLEFEVGAGDIVEEDLGDKQFTADGDITSTNGMPILGDPGADHKYEFSIEINYVLNDTVESRTQVFTIQGSSESTKQTLTITQSAGAARLEVTPATITVPQDGSVVNVQVTTNTTFTVS
jgi:hypothetical protein